MELLWLNGFWLIVPVLIWNGIFFAKLPQLLFNSDKGMPRWLLFLEHLLRVPVFLFPLFMTFAPDSTSWLAGLLLYILSSLAYFASWLPLIYLPESRWSKSLIGIISPFFLPLLVFCGAALMCNSWIYLAIAIVFTSTHVLHGLMGWKLFGAALMETNPPE